MKVRFLSAGDRALVVEFGDRIERALSDDVLRLDASLRSSGLPGVVETVPTFRSLMVHYDPVATTCVDLERAITSLLDRQPGPRAAATLWRVPVCYEGSFAPDLGEVANRTGLAPSEVVALHSGTRYHVYMLGFLPGFPYMGDLPPRLALPRGVARSTPIPWTEICEFHGTSAVGCIPDGTRISLVKSPGGDLGTLLIVLATGTVNP